MNGSRLSILSELHHLKNAIEAIIKHPDILSILSELHQAGEGGEGAGGVRGGFQFFLSCIPDLDCACVVSVHELSILSELHRNKRPVRRQSHEELGAGCFQFFLSCISRRSGAAPRLAGAFQFFLSCIGIDDQGCVERFCLSILSELHLNSMRASSSPYTFTSTASFQFFLSCILPRSSHIG